MDEDPGPDTPPVNEQLTEALDAAVDGASFALVLEDFRRRSRIASAAARAAYDEFVSTPGNVIQESVLGVTQMAFNYAWVQWHNERNQGS